ncbi:MAG: hypothetical protein J6X32_06885 [Salinivirgaceae bacterium]|jgi:hypothetical protein|nr:hypothetical protein [Salinivirgaceae bacterium]
MKRTLMIFAVAASLLASCEKYDHIDNSIWINDPDDICLPKYSEWGYNTFGAVMGRRSYFVSSWLETPCSMEWHNNDSTLEFTMNGCKAYKATVSGSEYRAYDDDDMSLTIIFPRDSIIDSCQKLYLLNGERIILTNPAIKILVKNGDNAPELVTDIRSGELFFKRVQMLYIDEKFEEAIVSGTFEIRYVKNGEKCELTDGRFDLGITPKLFW